MILNYQKICQELLNGLPQRQKEILSRRFGLKGGEKETLEAIGKDFGITRERVRQVEEDGFLKIKPKTAERQKIFQYFKQYLKRCGGFKKEEILLEELGGKKHQSQVYFLLAVSDDFRRFGEDLDFYSFWSIDKNSLGSVKNITGAIYNRFKKAGKPLGLKELDSFTDSKFLTNYLEVSKKILKNPDGFYGLKDWPEINPRGVKDKAYLVFKKIGKPLHFNEVAKSIEGALIQTVHNELIKDPRFILVGRGIYALKEWGYEPGQVKDVIAKILRENGPLTQGEILERVSKQRLVKENTILLNLSNKKIFLRNPQGKYKVLEI
ncbi:MAG TPA: sigma factor-like helix-turn-helix DNA-binding protein [Candidatus Humimicrobiaceae bacterium]|nr:sigma factor-like helix-turn-helix DNA-binding protein [Candidatus Humimicrobiaceae bacterium]